MTLFSIGVERNNCYTAGLNTAYTSSPFYTLPFFIFLLFALRFCLPEFAQQYRTAFIYFFLFFYLQNTNSKKNIKLKDKKKSSINAALSMFIIDIIIIKK